MELVLATLIAALLLALYKGHPAVRDRYFLSSLITVLVMIGLHSVTAVAAISIRSTDSIRDAAAWIGSISALSGFLGVFALWWLYRAFRRDLYFGPDREGRPALRTRIIALLEHLVRTNQRSVEWNEFLSYAFRDEEFVRAQEQLCADDCQSYVETRALTEMGLSRARELLEELSNDSGRE